jgi:hypothetical protein
MTTVAERQKQRFQFLNRIFEETGGNEHAIVNMWDIGNELGWDRESTQLAVQYLVGEGLIKTWALGGGIGITHSGVTEIERAVASPDEPTTYFPALINMTGDFRGAIFNIGSTLTDVSQTIGALSNVDDAVQVELQQLIEQLKEALQETPSEESEAVAWAAEALVDAAAEGKPNRFKVEISKDGLIKAAKNIAATMPAVLEIARQVVSAIDRLRQ